MTVLWISSLLHFGLAKSVELLVIEQKMTTALTRGMDQQVNAFATTILMVSIYYSVRSKIQNYPFKEQRTCATAIQTHNVWKICILKT